MDIFLSLAAVYMLGGFFGFILEVFYRRYVSMHRWYKPGFLAGPFIPLYGIGFLTFYAFGLMNWREWTPYLWLNYVLIILIIGAVLTLAEYIAGLIFIKGMKIKLWDYSKRWGNIQGIICPLFSLIWMAGGALYICLIHDNVLLPYTEWFIGGGAVSALLVGLFLGIHIMDIGYSMHLATRVRKAIDDSKFVAAWEEVKLAFQKKGKELGKKFTIAFPFSSGRVTDPKAVLAEYRAKSEENRKQWLDKVQAKKDGKAAKKTAKKEAKQHKDGD